MAQANAEANIVVTFTGGSIEPAKIPLRTLSRAFSAVQQLASGEDREEGSDDDDEDVNALSLIAVTTGSAVFHCRAAAPAEAVTNLRYVGRALDHPDEGDRAARVLNAIEEISAIARRLGCEVTVAPAGRADDVLATIRPTSHAQLSRSLLIEGETSLKGRVERAGGAVEGKCAIRVPGRGRLLFCSVEGPELVLELGKRLYQIVAVGGRAQWVRGTGEIKSFTITSVYQPQQGSLSQAFSELREAGGKAWNKVADPKRVLRRLTGE
ncbi:MAG TPA: hypothetical protein VF796_09985 [Humisphaera sp.]